MATVELTTGSSIDLREPMALDELGRLTGREIPVRPDELARWYAGHLGVIGPGESYQDPVWHQAAGETVFAPFGPEHAQSPHLGPMGWGLNFRVADLEAMVSQLRASGIEVEIDAERYPNGVFAQLHDPDGNPVQLWQHLPPEADGADLPSLPTVPAP